MPTVAVFGSLNVDRTYRVDYDRVREFRAAHEWFPDEGETRAVPDGTTAALPEPDAVGVGGKGANQAVAAARAGVEAALVGRVGPDAREAGVLEALSAAGVDASGVELVDARTGTAAVVVTPDGENRIAVEAGANGTVDPAFVADNADRLRAADVVLLQNEVPVAAGRAALEELRDVGDAPLVVLDPAPAEGAGPLVGPPVGYLTPNESERAALASALAGFEGTVIETRGPESVRVEGGESFEVSPPAVDAVDATGAGDAFAGYLAAELAGGRSLRAAVGRATVAASLSTTREGAQTAPDRAEVEAFPTD